jgi:hypothetical protein
VEEVVVVVERLEPRQCCVQAVEVAVAVAVAEAVAAVKEVVELGVR